MQLALRLHRLTGAVRPTEALLRLIGCTRRPPSPSRLSADEWTARAAAHEATRRPLDGAAPRAASRGAKPPGAGLPLHLLLRDAGAAAPLAPRRRAWLSSRRPDGPAPHAGRRWYATDAGGVVRAGRRRPSSPTAATPSASSGGCWRPRPAGRPFTGCFGLHEWAMVYRDRASTRHPVPLRLGQAGTDAVVEAHPIRCTHFDAFRFFTPPAVGRNRLQPTRETPARAGAARAACTRPWTSTSGPTSSAPPTPGELLADCFELAVDDPRAGHAGLAVRPARPRLRAGRDRDRRRARRSTSPRSAGSPSAAPSSARD